MREFYVDLLIEFIGAFLGFFSAALLQNISEKKEKKSKYKQVLDCLEDEFKDINRSLEKYVEAKKPLRHRIATPTWDAMKHSGVTLDLINEGFFEKMINAYSLIYAHNEDRNISPDEEILARLEEISTCIKEVLSIIEEKRSN